MVTPLSSFLACSDCGTLVPMVSESRSIADDSCELAAAADEFASEHSAHDLVRLHRTDTEPLSEGAPWDPMVRVHLELTDGERLYVATASRRSVDDERVYTFRPCCLRTVAAAVGIADNDVRRGLDLEFFPHAVRPTKVEDFLGALHEAIGELATEDLEIAFVDSADPAVSIAPMPEQAVQRVLTASSKIFDAWEFPLVERFLRQNRQETGVLALRVRRNAVIVED
jgi:hypothetical protein